MRSLLIAALAGIMPLSIAAPATACVRTVTAPGGPCLYWGLRSVPIYVNQAGSDDLDDGSDFTATEDGVGQWSSAACSDFAFDFRGLTSSTDVGYRVAEPGNQNLIVWREQLCRDVVPASDVCWSCLDTGEECCGSVYDCWEHPRGVIAVTTTTFSRITGALVDADIELNGVDYWFTTLDGPTCSDPEPAPRCVLDTDCLTGERCFDGFCGMEGCARTDIENTVTHEAGHIVGLDHSGEPSSTMYASAPGGEISKRSLEADDLECFCDAYPAGASTVTCFAREVIFTPLDQKKDTRGCGCQAAGGHGLGSGSFSLLLGLGLLLFFSRSRLRLDLRRPLRRIAPLLLLLAMPQLAIAHLLKAPPDLDGWIARGELAGLASAAEPPRPCGSSSRPAIQKVVVEVLVDEESSRELADSLLRRESIDVLLLDEHSPSVPVGALGPIVLAPSTELGQCSPLPKWQMVTPGPTALVVQHETDWMNYLGGVMELPDQGAARRSALEALWLKTLRADDATLLAHLTARLATLSKLPESAVGALARVAADPAQERSVRLRAIQLTGPGLDAPTYRALLGDSDLEIVEATLEMLRQAPPELLRDLEPRVLALSEADDGEVPRAVILRAAGLAVLSASGNPVHRDELHRLSAHRLFKARRWAILGLGQLQKKGDALSGRLLVRRWQLEPDARIRAVIEVQLGGRPDGLDDERDQDEKEEAQAQRRSSDLGLRMIFVLLGLLALAGMMLLPRFWRVGKPPTH